MEGCRPSGVVPGWHVGSLDFDIGVCGKLKERGMRTRGFLGYFGEQATVVGSETNGDANGFLVTGEGDHSTTPIAFGRALAVPLVGLAHYLQLTCKSRVIASACVLRENFREIRPSIMGD